MTGFICSVLENTQLVRSIQSHYHELLDEFDLTDVIDVLVSQHCLTPAQHTKVRETEGSRGLEKVKLKSF